MLPEVHRACFPIRNADRPFGEWNAFLIRLKGDCITITLHGQTVVDAARLPELPERGQVALQYHGDPVQFRRIWIKEMK